MIEYYKEIVSKSDLKFNPPTYIKIIHDEEVYILAPDYKTWVYSNITPDCILNRGYKQIKESKLVEELMLELL